MRSNRYRLWVTAAILLGTSSAGLADCWSSKDKANMAFDELGGTTTLSFRDAVTCEPLDNASVEIAGKTFTTNFLGEVGLELTGLVDERLPMRIRKEGYVEYKTVVEVAFNSAIKSRFAISKQLEARNLRFVLTWGAKPKDLDLHLTGPGFHVSYQDMHSFRNEARLDRDARLGHGPETITMERAKPGADYEVYVVNYLRDAPIDANTTVSVYAEGRLFGEVRLAPSSKPRIPIARIVDGRIELLGNR